MIYTDIIIWFISNSLNFQFLFVFITLIGENIDETFQQETCNPFQV